jgi:hypothetical protein
MSMSTPGGQWMLAIPLLLLPWLLAAFLQRRQKEPTARDWGEALLRGWLWTQLATLLTAEILSLGSFLTPGVLTAVWTGFAMVVLILVRPWRGFHIQPVYSEPAEGVPGAPWRWLMLGVILVLALLTLAAGLASAPNTSDSLSYRLPRVEQMAQAGHLGAFMSGSLRQLSMPPFPDIALAQLRILTHDDRLLALVQWQGFLVAILAAARIGGRIASGAGPDQARSARIWSALLVATVPMAVLQASSTQTDLLTAAFVLVLIERCLSWKPKPSLTVSIEIGITAGLLSLTKGTGVLVGLPFGLCFLGMVVRSRHSGCWQHALIAGCLACLLFVPHAIRQHQIFGTFLGPAGEGVLVERPGTAGFFDTALRHALQSLRPGDPVTTAWTAAAVDQLANWTGAISDRGGNTFPGSRFDEPLPWARIWHEDFAPAPLHSLLLVLAIGAALLSGRRAEPIGVRSYALAWLAAAALFALLIRWQVWGTRLQLPLLLAGMPLAGWWMANRFGRESAPLHRTLLAMPFVLSGFAAALLNQSRPLVGERSVLTVDRVRSMFANNPAEATEFVQIADRIRDESWTRIGMVGGETSSEYPLWALLRPRCPDCVLFHLLSNPRLTGVQPHPALPFTQAMVVLDQSGLASRLIQSGEWAEVIEGPGMSLWRRTDPAPLSLPTPVMLPPLNVPPSTLVWPTMPEFEIRITAAGQAMFHQGRQIGDSRPVAPGQTWSNMFDLDGDGRPEILRYPDPASGKSGATESLTADGRNGLLPPRPQPPLRQPGWQWVTSLSPADQCGDMIIWQNRLSGAKAAWWDGDCDGVIDRLAVIGSLGADPSVQVTGRVLDLTDGNSTDRSISGRSIAARSVADLLVLEHPSTGLSVVQLRVDGDKVMALTVMKAASRSDLDRQLADQHRQFVGVDMH